MLVEGSFNEPVALNDKTLITVAESAVDHYFKIFMWILLFLLVSLWMMKMILSLFRNSIKRKHNKTSAACNENNYPKSILERTNFDKVSSSQERSNNSRFENQFHQPSINFEINNTIGYSILQVSASRTDSLTHGNDVSSAANFNFDDTEGYDFSSNWEERQY